MTKKDVIAELARRSSVTRAEAEKILDNLNDIIIAETRKGENVYVGQIGQIKVKRSAEKTGRNPATGETIKIAAKNKPVFVPSKEYKKLLN